MTTEPLDPEDDGDEEEPVEPALDFDPNFGPAQLAKLPDMRKLAALRKEAQAISMREAGHDYTSIADTCGYATPETAAAAVRRGLKRATVKHAEDLRALELRRLDSMMQTYWPLMQVGDMQAAQLVLRVMERRAKLCGLDVTKQEITHKGRTQIQAIQITLDGDREEYIKRLKAVDATLKMAEMQALEPPKPEPAEPVDAELIEDDELESYDESKATPQEEAS